MLDAISARGESIISTCSVTGNQARPRNDTASVAQKVDSGSYESFF